MALRKKKTKKPNSPDADVLNWALPEEGLHPQRLSWHRSAGPSCLAGKQRIPLFLQDLPNQTRWLASIPPHRERSCARLEGALPSWLKASPSLNRAWHSPWSSPCIPGDLGAVRLWWHRVFIAPATGESQGWGSCCLQTPPPGTFSSWRSGIWGFYRLRARCKVQSSRGAAGDLLLQPDPRQEASSCPGSPGPCRPQRP